MNRLVFVGDKDVRALSFEPPYNRVDIDSVIDITTLGQQAKAVFDGEIENLYQELLVTGSSGGARP